MDLLLSWPPERGEGPGHEGLSATLLKLRPRGLAIPWTSALGGCATLSPCCVKRGSGPLLLLSLVAGGDPVPVCSLLPPTSETERIEAVNWCWPALAPR